MRFIDKVEVLAGKPNKPGIRKPARPQRASKPASTNKPASPNKATKPTKAGGGRQATGQTPIQDSGLPRLKAQLPEFYDLLSQTNPLDLRDPTWAQFFRKAGPRLMAVLLFDLKLIKRQDIPIMEKMFRRKIKED